MISALGTGLLAASMLTAGAMAAVRIPGLGVFGKVFGSGDVVRKTIAVKSFSRVRLASFGNLYVQIGNEESLIVEMEDNLFEHLKIEQFGNELSIGFDSFFLFGISTSHAINFYLTAKSMEGITVSGSGDVDVSDLKSEQLDLTISGLGSIECDRIECGRLTLTVSGSGDLESGDIQARQVEAKISGLGDISISGLKTNLLDTKITGSGKVNINRLEAQQVLSKISGLGDIHIEGKTDTQEVTLSGSGSYLAKDLESKTAKIRVSGLGSTHLNVSEELESRVTGSGSVHYRGNPRIQSDHRGLGELIHER